MTRHAGYARLSMKGNRLDHAAIAVMTHHDLLVVAKILAEARGVSLNTVSRWATGGTNAKLFSRIASGKGCSTRSVDRAAAWFIEHWPARLPWPKGVRR